MEFYTDIGRVIYYAKYNGGGGGLGMKNEDLGGKCRRGKEKRAAFSGIMLNLVDVLMRFQ